MNNIKILIFDEEELSQTLIENYLQEAVFSYEIKKYNEFNEKLLVNENQIIILNINRLNSDILSKISKLSLNKHNNFIAISYDEATDLRVKIFRAGFKDFLLKPLIKSDFLYSIQQIYKKYILSDDNKFYVYTVLQDKNNDKNILFTFNLSYEISKVSDNKVLIIDIPVSENNISKFINIKEFIKNNNENSDDKIYQYKDTNLYAVCMLPEANIEEYINRFKDKFKYIFINIADTLSINTKISLLNKIQDIFLLITESCIDNNLKEIMNKYCNNKRVKIILNMPDIKTDKLKEIIEADFRIAIYDNIPRNYIAIENARKTGNTFNEINPKYDVSQSYRIIAKNIMNRI